MQLFANLALALSLALSFISSSLAHAHQGSRHHHVHRQADLARRDAGSRFTYYAVGLGACGAVSQPTDFIVALNSAQFDSGAHCFATISITIDGKTVQAQIVDECPGCPPGGLDFSQGLFEYFAATSAGVLMGAWDYTPSPASSPSPSPIPTSVDIPATSWIPSPTTTTSQPPPTTTTSAPGTTSSSSSNSTAIISSTSSLVPTQTTTNAVAVTAGAVPVGTTDTSILFNVNLSVVYIGRFLAACNGRQ